MTFARAAASLAAPHSALKVVPVMIFTPSREARRFASVAATVGSGMSAIASVRRLPITPPWSLIMSRMISRPSTCSLPLAAIGPVIGFSAPILYSPLSACAPPPLALAAGAAPLAPVAGAAPLAPAAGLLAGAGWPADGAQARATIASGNPRPSRRRGSERNIGSSTLLQPERDRHPGGQGRRPA